MKIVKKHSKKVLLPLLLSGLFAGTVAADGPYPVNLNLAGDFTILSQTGITDVYRSTINGDVGTSPITGAALLLACDEVTGLIYTVDAFGPNCNKTITDATTLTLAVGDMVGAYNDAAGRTADVTELNAGEIGGLTLVPGTYKWSSNVSISTDVTLEGNEYDTWIFQIAGNLTEANGVRALLAGGALAKNIVWQVAGSVTLGTNSHFEGVVLSKTLIAVNTGTSVTGRLLAQTAVTLQKNEITEPVE
jgi:hypothetical protein